MASWNITRFHNDFKRWVRNKRYRKDVYRELEAAIALPTTTAAQTTRRLHELAFHLERVGICNRYEGASALLDGDGDGWRKLRCGLEASCWNVRTCRALVWGRFIRLDYLPFTAAQCLGQAMAMRCDAWADWLGAAMLEDVLALKRPLSTTTRSAAGAHLLRLYCTWRRREADWAAVRRPRPGIFRFLWTHWHHPAKFAAVIGKACEDHCAQIPPPQRGDLADVLHVFPVEILAVQRVRREQELPWPEIDHPLLATPLARIPARKIPECADPLIQKAIRILKAEVPALERKLAQGERS